MNSDPRESSAAELLEFYFDCHPDPDAMRERLATDPALRELYDEVRAQAELLERAAIADVSELVEVGGHTGASVGRGRVLWLPPRSYWPSLVAAACVILAFAHWGWREWRHSRLAHDTIVLRVDTSTAVPDGRTLQFEVRAFDAGDRTVAQRFDYVCFDAAGRELARGDGIANTVPIVLPATLPGARDLRIRATTPLGEREVAVPLAPHDAAPLLHLATDKPIYRPGETVRARAVALDRLTLRPWKRESVAASTLRIVDTQGAPVAAFQRGHDAESEALGVAFGEWRIPDDAVGGRYVLTSADSRGRRPDVRHEFVVRRFEAPRLATRLELDRESYAPGAAGVADLEVRRLAGDAAADAAVRAAIVLDGAEVWSTETRLDANGRARVPFGIPTAVERGEARFVARITDGGNRETTIEPFVVPTGELRVDAYPEGGELVAGAASRLYLAITDSVGRAVDATGRLIEVDSGREVATFRTEHAGRARVAFVPSAGARYVCELDDAGREPTRHPLEDVAVKARGVALTTHDDVVAASAPLRATIRVVGDGSAQHTIAAFVRGACVATQQIAGSGEHEVELALPREVFGVMRVTVFDADLRPRAERLVQRQAERGIDVSTVVANDALAPGARQRLTFDARGPDGAPLVGVALGVTVSDHAVRSLDGEPRVGLLDRAMLFGDVTIPADLADYLPETVGSARHVDLLLGTLGWRRFVWSRSDAELTAAGDEVHDVASLEGLGLSTVSHRASVDDRDALRATAQDARRAREFARPVAAIGLFLVLLNLAIVASVALMRRVGVVQTRFGAVVVGTSASVVVIGAALWSTNRVLESESLAPAVAAAMEDRGGFLAGLGGEEEKIWLADEDVDAEEDLLTDLLTEEVEAPSSPPVMAPAADDRDEELPTRPMTPRVRREYAHVHAGADDVRSDFTDTLYWNVLLITDANGRATAEFDISDRITTWDIDIDAHDPARGLLGQSHATFDSRQPLFLDVTLPVAMTEGDRLELPVALTSGDLALSEAELAARVGGRLQVDGATRQSIALRDGRGRARLPIVVTPAVDGDQRGGADRTQDATTASTIRIATAAGRFRDVVQREIRISPRGFPHRRSWAGSSTEEFVVPMPGSAERGSVALVAKFFPSPLASLREGLAGIVQEPHGCFEQASSANYPNTLVLAYLEASGDVIPTVANDAAAMLPRGYDKIVGYECARRGFEWFGADPGHEALTAYGLLEFTDMGAVYDAVDPAMVARTRDWLLSRRDGQGGFLRDPEAIDGFGRAPDPTNAAYIVYALLYAGEASGSLAAEIDALAARATTSDDSYELALIANAMTLAGREEIAGATLGRLRSMQAENGSVGGAVTSITRSGGRDLIIETTSLAMLAWLGDPSDAYAANVRRAAEFVQSCQSARGTFGATQATILALRALTECARADRRAPTTGTLRISCDEREVARHEFSSADVDPLVVALEGFVGTGGEHRMRFTIEFAGGEVGLLPWACDLSYHSAQPADDPDGVVGIVTSFAASAIEAPGAGSVDEGDTIAVRIRVENRSDEGQPMAIANVGLPAGLEAPTAVLDALRDAGAFAFWELRDRTVTFYWRDLAPRIVHEFVLDCVAKIPGLSTGPASSAYLYYTPERRRWAEGLRVRVR